MIVLHILWILIRILLTLLGIFLGLVLLLLLLVLFCPVRYQASVTKETKRFQEAAALVSVSWLFRGIHLIISFENGKADPDIRLFGISLKRVKAFPETRKEKKQSSGSQKPLKERKAPDAGTESEGQEPEVSENPEGARKAPKEQAALEKTKSWGIPKEQESPDIIEEPEREPAVSDMPEEPEPPVVLEEPEKEPAAMDVRKEAVAQAADSDTGEGSFIGRILDRLAALFEKLGEKLGSLEKKKDAFVRKIQHWKRFLTHPRVKRAASLVWKKLVFLLRHILPTRIYGELFFGFSDPAITGRILMLMGMTIPLHKNSVELHPDFEGENHIEGTLRLKGRVYGIVFAAAVLRILFDKNIRYVYRRLKKKEE